MKKINAEVTRVRIEKTSAQEPLIKNCRENHAKCPQREPLWESFAKENQSSEEAHTKPHEASPDSRGPPASKALGPAEHKHKLLSQTEKRKKPQINAALEPLGRGKRLATHARAEKSMRGSTTSRMTQKHTAQNALRKVYTPNSCCLTFRLGGFITGKDECGAGSERGLLRTGAAG